MERSARRIARVPAWLTLVTMGLLAGVWSFAEGRIDAPIIFTQIQTGTHLEGRPPPAEGMLRADWGVGGRIVRLDPDGRLRVLTPGFASAADPATSFDAERILFAGQRRANDPWNIYEMKADGSQVRQITKDLGDCRQPAYMATVYTLPPPPRVDTDPWQQVMFVSIADGRMNEYGSGPATSLYSIKLDGTFPRRLTFNLSNDMDPFLMQDGRILVACWQRADLRRGLVGRVSIFGVNLDGLDYAPYVLDEGMRVKHMPCATTKGLVVFVEGDRVPWDGGGHLAAVTTRRNFHSYRRLTNDAEGLYLTPAPLPDGSVLVSRRPTDKSAAHALYRFDPDSGDAELLFDDPDHHDIQAKLLAPRPVPKGRSTVVSEQRTTGRFYCLNVYVSDLPGLRSLPLGTVKRLRVLEGVALRVDERGQYLPDGLRIGIGGPGSHAVGIPPLVQKRLLGEVPVEEDGSFNIEVPANVPVQLQTLDAKGMAVEASGWIWAKNREARGCIGCHEDPELAPENVFVKALRRESHKLLLPPERRRTVDFRRDVMPIIETKCASPACHGGAEPPMLGGGMTLVSHGDAGAYFNRAYESLLAAMGDGPPGLDTPVHGKYVVPGRARESRLIWHLFGYDTSALNPRPGGARRYAPMPPRGCAPLTEDEKLTFIEWIDLGALWDGIPGPDPFSSGGVQE